MGVYRRKDSKSPYFQFEFELRTGEGKKRKRFRGSTRCTSVREAEAFERAEKARRRLELDAALANAVAPDTVSDVFARYWTAHGHKLKWAYTVEKHMVAMEAHFGADRMFCTISGADVASMLEAYAATTERKNRAGKKRAPTVRAARPSDSSINRRLAVFRGIHTMARDVWELPVKNIVWKVHKRREPKASVRHIETGKAKEILGHLPERLKVFAAWLFATGCRRNESETLTWDRVNFETCQAEVLTKGGGTRFVDLGPDALNILGLCDRGRTLVFDARGLRKAWHKACAAAGVPGFRVHDARHSYAVWMGNKGIDIAVLQQLLGHSDIRVTTKYRRVIRAEMQKAVQSVPTLIEGPIASIEKKG
jgi:integrase